MFELPDTYKVDVNVALKDFIPKDLKTNDKKRIKDVVKSVKLKYQIAGEEIPSINNEEYRCQVIQFYDIEVEDIRDANFLAVTYQSLIKPLCVLHIYDTNDEVYSLAIKRLNQIDDTQIVVEDSLITPMFMLNIPDSQRSRFLQYLSFTQIKNKQNKVELYREWFYKAYILKNDGAYAKAETVLNSNIWYDPDKTARIASKYTELVKQRNNLKKAVTNAEYMKVNKSIKMVLESLNSENLQ